MKSYIRNQDGFFNNLHQISSAMPSIVYSTLDGKCFSFDSLAFVRTKSSQEAIVYIIHCCLMNKRKTCQNPRHLPNLFCLFNNHHHVQ